MRAALPVALGVLLAALAACGESAGDRLARETAAEAGPEVERFAADLDAGRVEAALARSTRAFQGAARADAVRAVHESLRRSLGAARSRTPRGAEAVVAEPGAAAGAAPRAREAVLLFDGAFERGAATIRARVQRDAARGGWLVDGYEVRSDLFTFTYRK